MLTDERPDHPTDLRTADRRTDLELRLDVVIDLDHFQVELVTMGALPPFTIPRGGFFG